MENLLLLSGAALLFAFLFAIAAYVFVSLGVSKVLKYFNHKNTWGAWIPLYNNICLAECMKADENGNIKFIAWDIPKKYFRLWPLLPLVLSYVPKVGSFLTLAVTVVCTFFMLKDLLSQESGNDETGLAVVSALISIVWVILCFTRFKGTKPVELVEPNPVEVEETVETIQETTTIY